MIPHWVPLHVARPFGSVGHGVQAEPQPAGLLFATQVLSHRWYSELHSTPQARGVPLHVAVLFAGRGQALQEVPQPLMLSLATQVVPHR